MMKKRLAYHQLKVGMQVMDRYDSKVVITKLDKCASCDTDSVWYREEGKAFTNSVHYDGHFHACVPEPRNNK